MNLPPRDRGEEPRQEANRSADEDEGRGRDGDEVDRDAREKLWKEKRRDGESVEVRYRERETESRRRQRDGGAQDDEKEYSRRGRDDDYHHSHHSNGDAGRDRGDELRRERHRSSDEDDDRGRDDDLDGGDVRERKGKERRRDGGTVELRYRERVRERGWVGDGGSQKDETDRVEYWRGGRNDEDDHRSRETGRDPESRRFQSSAVDRSNRLSRSEERQEFSRANELRGKRRGEKDRERDSTMSGNEETEEEKPSDSRGKWRHDSEDYPSYDGRDLENRRVQSAVVDGSRMTDEEEQEPLKANVSRRNKKRDTGDIPSDDGRDEECRRLESAVDRSSWMSRREDEGPESSKANDVRGSKRRETGDFPSRDRRDPEGRRLESGVDRSRVRVSREDEAGQDSSKANDYREAKRRDSTDHRERERFDDASVPELHSIHKASVHSIRPFGLFVRLEGYRNHGLVHLSQVSDHEVTKRDDSDEAKIEALASVAGEGEQVWVKVISVEEAEHNGRVKIGCSLKYVSQKDGTDLDPNNVQLDSSLQHSKPAWQAPKKLQLEAVYNVTCTRCGGHGHLKKECYSGSGKTYELLQADDDDEPSPMAPSVPAPKNSLQPDHRQSSKPPSGPTGRGRAMVQPAWMKHGVVGIGVPQEIEKGLGHKSSDIDYKGHRISSRSHKHDEESRSDDDNPSDRREKSSSKPKSKSRHSAASHHEDSRSEDPENSKSMSVQEALDVIAKLKKERRSRRRERDGKREHKRDRKKHGSSKEGKRNGQRKRRSRRSSTSTSSEDHDHRSPKKHRL